MNRKINSFMPECAELKQPSPEKKRTVAKEKMSLEETDVRWQQKVSKLKYIEKAVGVIRLI